MANDCDNRLVIQGKSGVLACLEAIRGEPDCTGYCAAIDFQKIVPMPDCLKMSKAGTETDVGLALFDDCRAQELLSSKFSNSTCTDLEGLRAHIRAHYPEAEEAGRKALQFIQETGFPSWYEWCWNKWGCKWNASHSSVRAHSTDARAVLYFTTPWCPPYMAMFALSARFGNLRFSLSFQVEYGDAGTLPIYGGEVLKDTRFD
jgi:hypothetical protein